MKRNTSIPQAIVGFFVLALFAFLSLEPDVYKATVKSAFNWSTINFGFYWQMLVFALFTVSLLVAFSPSGKKRFGDQKPEMGYFSWLAIIMSTLLAGGGIFWSAAEPLFHVQNTPLPFEGENMEAETAALAQSFFHWGFLAWTALGTLAIIPLQSVVKNKLLRNRPCLLLYPLIPKKYLMGPTGDFIDILCVASVLVGTIGPIGFLGVQLSYIISQSSLLPDSIFTQLLLIALLAIVYTISAVRGVKKGIRVLSLANMALCVSFGLLILISISPQKLGRLLAASGSAYVTHFLEMSFIDPAASWTHNWTHFFWGWFLGYGPIMSIFIYKISKGRTLREVILTICLVAPVITNFWFSVVGGSGIIHEAKSGGLISDSLNTDGMPAALFKIIELSDFSYLLVFLVVPLIFFFMATTGDSIALSISNIFSKGEEAKGRSKIFWSISMAATAAAILVIGREQSISIFQQSIVVAAVPVSIIMLFASISGIMVLRKTRKSDTLEV